MGLDAATRDRIGSLIRSNDVMLFMKGDRNAPRCGFSATVVRILETLTPDYGTFDVLADPAVREGLKEFSAWPTIPQLYVKGEFVGGCDIVQELFQSGELQQKLGVEPGAPRQDAPGAARGVGAMDVHELRRRLDAGERFEFFDVRSEEEREIAAIPGTTLLTREEVERIGQLPKHTILVFHCHHGGRSQGAAEHFHALGFTDVWNVVGGIDAWAAEIDRSLTRY